MIIVIGGSSFIGSKISEHFSEGEKVTGTYYNNSKEGLVYFDLKNPDLRNLGVDLGRVKCVVVCSAMARPDDCKKNEKESYEINVMGTRKLLEQCFELGIFPVWFSSEYVFSGEKGNYREFDERNPNTVYGKQKKEIEDFLLNSGRDFLILRLSKVFGLNKSDGTYIVSMIEQLLKGDDIKCADDQIFNPLYVGDLVRVLDICLQRNLKGLYNTASPEKFSRFEIGEMVKGELGRRVENVGDVIKCSLKDFDFLDNRPLNTTMNVDKLIKDTGFEFKGLRECVRELIKVYE